MSEPLPLTGPDLDAGVPLDHVPEGSILRGHAFGVPLILSRLDGVFHAVAAACTHYGAPLDEGLVTGHHLRCPWHHACFDLRTGEALRAPALRPLQRYGTEVTGSSVRVTGPIPEERQLSRAGPSSVVNVGAGAAGAAAAEALRNAGYQGPITMLGREMPVDRPNLSKDYLAGTAPEEWMPLREPEFYAGQGIEVRIAEARRVDPAARRIELSDGTSISYGACLLATGADPVRPPIPGLDRPNVFTLRTLADSRAIIAAARGRAVVLGASFIGLETAASLRARDVEVHVVAPEAVPLAKILGEAVGTAVRSVHEQRGVRFHLGLTATAIEEGAVLLSDGTRLLADLVVVGVGVRPALALAEEAGLGVDKGVLVDGQLRTSDAAIWAAGDIARWPDPHTGTRQRIEHWVLAERQGQTAARNILGFEEPFDALPFFWSAHYDLILNVVGFLGDWDRVDVDGDIAARDATIVYRKGDRTVAVATVGRDRACLEAEVMLERDDQAGLARLGRSSAP